MSKNIVVYGTYPTRLMVEKAIEDLKDTGFRHTHNAELLITDEDTDEFAFSFIFPVSILGVDRKQQSPFDPPFITVGFILGNKNANQRPGYTAEHQPVPAAAME